MRAVAPAAAVHDDDPGTTDDDDQGTTDDDDDEDEYACDDGAAALARWAGRQSGAAGANAVAQALAAQAGLGESRERTPDTDDRVTLLSVTMLGEVEAQLPVDELRALLGSLDSAKGTPPQPAAEGPRVDALSSGGFGEEVVRRAYLEEAATAGSTLVISFGGLVQGMGALGTHDFVGVHVYMYTHNIHARLCGRSR